MNIGGATGIPDYLANVINKMLTCDNIWIDGKEYTKIDGSNMQAIDNGGETFPFCSWNIELSEVSDSNMQEMDYIDTALADTSKISVAADRNPQNGNWAKSVKGYKS